MGGIWELTKLLELALHILRHCAGVFISWGVINTTCALPWAGTKPCLHDWKWFPGPEFLYFVPLFWGLMRSQPCKCYKNNSFSPKTVLLPERSIPQEWEDLMAHKAFAVSPAVASAPHCWSLFYQWCHIKSFIPGISHRCFPASVWSLPPASHSKFTL